MGKVEADLEGRRTVDARHQPPKVSAAEKR